MLTNNTSNEIMTEENVGEDGRQSMTSGNIPEDDSRGIAIDLESAEEGVQDMAPQGDMMVSTSFIVFRDDETTIWIEADGGRVQVTRDE